MNEHEKDNSNSDYVEKLNAESSQELTSSEMILEREKIILERERLSHEREMLEFERAKWESNQKYSASGRSKSTALLVVGFFSLLFLVFGVIFGYVLNKPTQKDSFLSSSALIQKLDSTNILSRELFSGELSDVEDKGSTYLLILK
jgi:hypothetical protein